MFGLRLGKDPRAVVTTTPRPSEIIRRLLKDPNVHVTRGNTYENRANLAPAFLETIVQRYEGTRLGRQEVYAEVLDDNPGALFHREHIDENRCMEPPEMEEICVAIDPAMSGGDEANETGILVAGRGPAPNGWQRKTPIVIPGISPGKHFYPMADMSLRASPDGWARRAVYAYQQYKANYIVYEANQGGEMVAATLRTIDPNLPLRRVWATRGKSIRAEPVASIYEQGRAHHVGQFPQLEDEMCGWDPQANAPSPNRLDALVWAGHSLMLGAEQPLLIVLPDGASRPSYWRI